MMNADLLLRPGSLTPSLLGLALALLLPFAAQAGSGALRVISDENYPPYLFLNAESTPGVGSIFWLRVPLGIARKTTGTPGSGPDPHGQRVLMVEDNELNQEVATELLREAGLEVDLAPDGAVALAKVAEVLVPLIAAIAERLALAGPAR